MGVLVLFCPGIPMESETQRLRPRVATTIEMSEKTSDVLFIHATNVARADDRKIHYSVSGCQLWGQFWGAMGPIGGLVRMGVCQVPACCYGTTKLCSVFEDWDGCMPNPSCCPSPWSHFLVLALGPWLWSLFSSPGTGSLVSVTGPRSLLLGRCMVPGSSA